MNIPQCGTLFSPHMRLYLIDKVVNKKKKQKKLYIDYVFTLELKKTLKENKLKYHCLFISLRSNLNNSFSFSENQVG